MYLYIQFVHVVDIVAAVVAVFLFLYMCEYVHVKKRFWGYCIGSNRVWIFAIFFTSSSSGPSVLAEHDRDSAVLPHVL